MLKQVIKAAKNKLIDGKDRSQRVRSYEPTAQLKIYTL